MLDQSEMPFTEDGLVPDLIINPHGTPKRMVVGQLLEGLLGELAIRRGARVDATAFRRLDAEALVAELARLGVPDAAHRRLYSGRTGEWMDALVFMVPNGYQRLQKFVMDDSYSVAEGPTNALTRQPLTGKARRGGLRVGEMEKDAILAHGSMRALQNKFFDHSDGRTLPVCRTCGKRDAVWNRAAELYGCWRCRDRGDVAAVPSAWSTSLFLNEIAAMGVQAELELEPPPAPTAVGEPPL